MTRDELRAKANDLPLLPGVYLMMDKTGQVIYVGKAKKLKNRVSQYFQDTASHNEKTKMMVAHVDRFDTIIVRSEAAGTNRAGHWTPCAPPCACQPVPEGSPATSARSAPA